MTTVKAAFGRWVPLVNLDQRTPIPRCFVLKLPDKLSPTHITDSFRQTAILDHVLDGKTLDAYDLVFAYGVSRELMLVVSSAICNLLMDTSDLETSLGLVLGPLFLFCMTALCFGKLLLVFGEELRIAIGVPIAGDDHRLQTQVKSYYLRRDFQGLDVFFYQDGDKIAISLVFGDGNSTWQPSIWQGAMPNDGKRSIHLRQRESMPVPGKGVTRISCGLLIAFLFEDGI